MENQQLVHEQYGAVSLQDRVNDALWRAGLGTVTLTWSDLVPLDQFHVRGLAATRQLAEALSIQPGSHVVDVGCGLGGPARFLAATYACRVTGIDLTQPFIDVATTLTERCGLTQSVTFRRADALALPFAESSFDDAWTQHVAMNIVDRKTFYAEIYRVLKPGGRLAIYDVLAGDGRPLIFPVPWARRSKLSFLLTSAEMKDLLGETGFQELSWVDKTADSLAWLAELKSRVQNKRPLGIDVVMGDHFPEMAENLGRNLQAGRLRLVQAVVRRA